MNRPETLSSAGKQSGSRARSLDLAHTEAAFDARSWHGAVHGTVPVVAGHVVVDAQGAPIAMTAELDLDRISTGNLRRDRDLRGRRFFDTERYPTMIFGSDDVRADGAGWTVSGDLGVAATRCPLVLTVRPDPVATGGYLATVSLDPRDLGIRVPRLFVRRLVTLRISTRLN